MLFALTAALVVIPIICLIFEFLFMMDNHKNGKKLFSPEVKALLAVCIVCITLAIPLHFAQDAVAKNIETETSYTDLDSENCYMVTSMSKNGNTLFICKTADGELRYVWAKLDETSSTPCLETTTYHMTKFEKFLTNQVENTYVVSTDSKYITYVYDINDVIIV